MKQLSHQSFIYLIFCLSLITCTGNKNLKTANYSFSNIQVVQPIVLIKSPNNMIDTGFTTEYITDYTNILIEGMGLDAKQSPDYVNTVAHEFELDSIINSISSGKANSKIIDLKRYGITPTRKRLLFLFQTGYEPSPAQSKGSHWIALGGLVAGAVGVALIPYTHVDEGLSTLKAVVVDSKSGSVKAIVEENGIHPMDREMLESQLDVVFDKLLQ